MSESKGRVFTINLYFRGSDSITVRSCIPEDELDEFIGMIDNIEGVVGSKESNIFALPTDLGRLVLNTRLLCAFTWNDGAWTE